MKLQQTIERPVEIAGRGLFTGEPATLRFRPAPVGTGVVFVRDDQNPPIHIAARVDNVAKRLRRTSIRNGTVQIETIEHCMAALAGMGVDNAFVELNGNEVPGLDGSCLPFVEKIKEAGLVQQDRPREIYRIPETIRVSDGPGYVMAAPGTEEEDALEIIYDLNYGPNNPIGQQIFKVRLTPETFEEQIAGSRTFVLRQEAEQLQAAGLGRHLTYQEILVFGPDGPIDNPLRFANECVRHKILDLIGDMYLFGKPLVGSIFARQSGHSLNHELVRRLQELEEAAATRRRLSSEPAFDIRQIQRILPHRFPFLMVDRVVLLEPGQRAVGIKNVTANEEFFTGHYPGQPIMPGVLIIEAMAQLGGILLSRELEHTGKVAVLLSLDRVKFRRPVVPGDQLVMEALARRVKSRTGHVSCTARVNDDLVAEADIKFMMVDADPL
ncbi:MAG TPA: UDP-3-O-acyl-N-acetylglucosamine deacetylase [Phycisphaerae bacterium]|nr:UDP-3-O-acyl-N-acetylglucosamine deacetylase [Phycisphaerae bacterium]HRY66573.1 UDP-3-O-acyl-N-acetylglucosamine deacetylase [Phycisphaerae bacterium]HSA26993.1 UDP-3-O-acyl-N-acetylglucosamine deacetylase [Phycisphaerae bacterium]